MSLLASLYTTTMLVSLFTYIFFMLEAMPNFLRYYATTELGDKEHDKGFFLVLTLFVDMVMSLLSLHSVFFVAVVHAIYLYLYSGWSRFLYNKWARFAFVGYYATEPLRQILYVVDHVITPIFPPHI